MAGSDTCVPHPSVEALRDTVMYGSAEFRGLPIASSTMSRPSRARAQGDEQLVQLREPLGHPALHSGEGTVERVLRGIELVHHQQRPAALFLERHRGDGTVGAFLIGP